MVDRIRQLYRLMHELEQKLGRVPTNEELAVELDTSPTKIDWMIRVSWLPLSLESPINEDEEESELGMFVEDTLTPTPIQTTYNTMLRERIEAVGGQGPGAVAVSNQIGVVRSIPTTEFIS